MDLTYYLDTFVIAGGGVCGLPWLQSLGSRVNDRHRVVYTCLSCEGTPQL